MASSSDGSQAARSRARTDSDASVQWRCLEHSGSSTVDYLLAVQKHEDADPGGASRVSRKGSDRGCRPRASHWACTPVSSVGTQNSCHSLRTKDSTGYVSEVVSILLSSEEAWLLVAR